MPKLFAGYKFSILFFFISLVFCKSIFGQQAAYHTTHFTTKDGLPHNRIDAIVQDQSGFIWIGTWNGLSRFDGNEFVNYRHDPDNPSSLPYFAVFALICDHENNLWIATPPGFPLGLYDRKNNCFHSYSAKMQGKYHIRSEKFLVCADTSGILWILGNKGVERFNRITGSFDPVPVDYRIPGCRDSVPTYPESQLKFDNLNNPWFYTGQRVFLAEVSGEKSKKAIKIVREYHFEKNRPIPEECMFFTNASGSRLCISSSGWYHCRYPSTVFMGMKTSLLPEIFGLPDTLTWYEPGRIRVKMGPAGLKDVITDQDKKINVPFIDKAGNLWYAEYLEKATGFQGLKKVTFVRNSFTNIFFKDLIPEAPTIYSICKTGSGDMVVASNSAGLIGWNKKSFRIPELFRNTQSTFPEGVMTDHTNNLWVSYNDGKLARYTGNLDQPVEVLPRFAKTTGTDFIKHFKVLETDLNGNLVIGGTRGLAIFDPDSLKRIYSLSFSGMNQVRSVCVNRQNDLVIGTQTGLIYLDRKTNSVRELPLPIPNTYWIESICRYSDSIYWLGLLGGGICKWNSDLNTFKVLTTRDGLCDNSVYCILKDHNGNLWISTNEGISRFNPVSGLFTNYGPDEGLQVSEFNSGASFQAPDGEIFFGGIEGVVRFYPDSILKSESNSVSKLMITDFRVSGANRFFDKAIYECSEVRLDRGTDNFQLGFALLEFNKPDRVRYRYRLEPYNDHWIYTDHMHRFVNYINLSPGSYRFMVEATDNSGNWSKSKILTIVIPAKFFQTSWFKALIALITLSLIIFVVYSRFRVLILRQKQHKERLTLALKESKLEVLRKQLNPHFIYNSLNSINYYIALNDKIKANQFVTDFARLMRNILEHSSQEMIDFDKEAETLEDYLSLEKIRFNNRFDYEIIAEESLNRMATMVMPSMVQPFAENAIIHGLSNLKSRPGRLNIRFSGMEGHSLTCTIEDNGTGRKRSEEIRRRDQRERKTMGIHIIAERLSIFNAINGTDLKLVVEDLYPEEEETGTRVVIQIPAKQKI